MHRRLRLPAAVIPLLTVKVPRRITVLLALVGVLILQVLVWERHRQVPLPTGPSRGEPLPPVVVGLLSDASPAQIALDELLGTTGSCSLLVMVSTSCPICARMRVTWPERLRTWTDSLTMPVTTVWLSEEGRDEFANFVAGYNELGRAVDIFTFNGGPGSELFRRLGLVGTPMLFLTDNEGRLAFGVGGDRFPPASVVNRSCRGGV